MRHIFLFILLWFALPFCLSVSAQTESMNYVKSRNYLGTDEYLDEIVYHDGLGRPVETIRQSYAPNRQDIISYQEYDRADNLIRQWLPIPAQTTGQYMAESVFRSSALQQGLYGNDTNPYKETIYEPSPLNRPLKSFGPGQAWYTATKYQSTEYLTNKETGELNCAYYEVTNDHKLIKRGNWYEGELYVNKQTDEDGYVYYIFTNLLEQKVLVRRLAGKAFEDTYYVYDVYGDLRYVLPPAASEKLTDVKKTWSMADNKTLSDYGYYYQYDGRHHCVEKKLPGCEPIKMHYDYADHLVGIQDGNLRKQNLWKFILYDAFGRITVVGLCKSASFAPGGRVVITSHYTGKGVLGGYESNVGFPNPVVLKVLYYDEYTFIDDLENIHKSHLIHTGDNQSSGNLSPVAMGLLTGERVRMLETDSFLVSVYYYDADGRRIQTRSTNHLGGYNEETLQLSMTGKVLQRHYEHTIKEEYRIVQNFIYQYDHAERLLTVNHQFMNHPAVTLAKYSYDDIGRMVCKEMGGGREKTVYSYNVRGQLTKQTGQSFSELIAYQGPVDGVSPVKACYNGNISASAWLVEGKRRGYKYSYDSMGRLIHAVYGEGTDLSVNIGRFDEQMNYDKMGNITKLQRKGLQDNGQYGAIDKLVYEYSGNRLVRVSDAISGPLYVGAFHFMDGEDLGEEYIYDANGNMTKDYNKKIVDIQYNLLNLPRGMQFAAGHTINWLHDANGQKLRTSYHTAKIGVSIPMTSVMTPLKPSETMMKTQTDYSGNLIYEDGKLSKILTDEGYISFKGNTPVYHYYLRDHLGSIRVVIDDNGSVEQVNHYYPFGGLFGESTGGGTQPYKYNGKELDRMHGLDWYDYGARHSDAALGKWMCMDPLAEKYHDVTPYGYCHENPVRLVDKDGKDDYYDNAGMFVFKDDKNTNNIMILDFSYYLRQMTGAEWLPKGYKSIKDVILSAEAYSHILTDVLCRYSGPHPDRLYNGEVSVVVSPDNERIVSTYNNPNLLSTALGNDNASTRKMDDGSIKVTACINYEGVFDNRELFSTADNIYNLLYRHEYKGHGLMRLSDHYKVYQLQFSDPSWEKATDEFKRRMQKESEQYK